MNKNFPVVSVLINNYNYDKFLREAIESVLNQTYKDFELIIVDDGSTDDSRIIIDGYHKKYPHIIIPVYKENGGQASAFNAGFKASKGEIIAFLDSDDYWFPDKLQRIVEVHEQYAIVQHNLLKGRERYRLISNKSDKQRLLKEFGYIGAFIPTSGLSFRRDLLEKVFPIPEESLKICSETFVLCNALCYDNIYSINDCLGFYRVHGNNQWYGKEDSDRSNFILEELNKKLRNGKRRTIPVHESQGAALINSVPLSFKQAYILYGAGGYGIKFLEHIINSGGKVKFFCDSDSEKWGKEIRGVEIIAPEQIKELMSESDRILISSGYTEDILERLMELGIDEKYVIVPTIDIKE